MSCSIKPHLLILQVIQSCKCGRTTTVMSNYTGQMGTYVSTLGSKSFLVSVCVTDDLCHITLCEHLPEAPKLKDLRQVEKPQGGKGTVLQQCLTHSYIH